MGVGHELMAFTEAEKVQIRRFLGIPAGYRDLHIDIEGRIQLLEQEINLETAAKALIVEIQTVRDAIGANANFLKRMQVESVDRGGVKLRGWEEVRIVRAEGRRLVLDLVTMMDLHAWGFPLNDIFGQRTGPTSGGRGTMKLG